MFMNTNHQILLKRIQALSGKPTQHTFLNTYLGTEHPRYAIDNPTMRALAKTFIKQSPMNERSFLALLTSLIKGKSFTEKVMAGFLLDYAGKNLWAFNPVIFTRWLPHLQGWAEVDTLCTGKYAVYAIPEQFDQWKKVLSTLSKSQQLEERRASLVLCCSPLRKQQHDALLNVAFRNILRLKSEKEVMITKAISWVLRSAINHHRQQVKEFVNLHTSTLPKIAVRETLTKLKTGRKNPSTRTAGANKKRPV
jgi:3-methyladenine DNA glycosylase AlkD